MTIPTKMVTGTLSRHMLKYVSFCIQCLLVWEVLEMVSLPATSQWILTVLLLNSACIFFQLEVLKHYLDGGGNILVMLGEGGEMKYDTNINFLLEEFGIMVNNGACRILLKWQLTQSNAVKGIFVTIVNCWILWCLFFPSSLLQMLLWGMSITNTSILRRRLFPMVY